ncbi:MAG: nucleotidyl transferase AbiEii/AbiGii toxin family protein [Phycisphaerales bacterium]|nr:nucleotidyl transferase AbiEii/AbiGii toxin family protein [Phycisphaerales bacterium]
MDKIARLPAEQRQELFGATATNRGLNPAIVEKDFWVCWVLRALFTDDAMKKRVVFKGGTSLSKVFGLIDRFSEDIDLVLDWRLFGFGQSATDPWQQFTSKTQRERFNRQVNEAAATYIASTLLADLAALLQVCPGVLPSLDPDAPHAVNVAYPAAFSEAYLRPMVRLEIGPLASWIPSHPYTIRPYAADEFPNVFEQPDCPVVAIDAERTFWEKATILHQQAHRSDLMPLRYSRHYYDMHRLALSAVRSAALRDLQLLADVVEFKQRFYPSSWARYEDAKPGTLRLVPADERLAELRRDYRDMRQMLFGDVPEFDEIVVSLRELEATINRL